MFDFWFKKEGLSPFWNGYLKVLCLLSLQKRTATFPFETQKEGSSLLWNGSLKVLCLLSFKKVGYQQSFPFSTGSFQEARCKTQVFPVFHRFLHSRWRKTQRRFSAPLSGLVEFSTVFTPPTTTTRIVNSFCVQNDENILPNPAKWRIRCGKQKGTYFTTQLPKRRVYLQDKDRERTCHEI